MSFLGLAEIISFGDKSLNKKVSDHIQIYIGRLSDCFLPTEPGQDSLGRT